MLTLHTNALGYPDLYYAVFDAARRVALAMPRTTIARGMRVVRELERDALVVANDERAARTIFDGSRSTSQRWTGAQAGGRREPGRGGLYVVLEREATLEAALRHRRVRVNAHIAQRLGAALEEVGSSATSPTKHRLHVFELTRNLTAIDLGQAVLRPLLARLNREVDVRHELGRCDFADLTSAWYALRDDASISRALGNAALMRTGAEALLVDSAPSDYACLLGSPGPRGRSAVLAGTDNIPLPYLRPLYRLACEDVGGGALRCERLAS